MAVPVVISEMRIEANRCGHLVPGMAERDKAPMRLVHFEYLGADPAAPERPPLILYVFQCQTCLQVSTQAVSWEFEIPVQLPA